MDGKTIAIIVLLIIVIICYTVTTCRVYVAIGHSDDQAAFSNSGYLFAAGLFALSTAIACAVAMPENDVTLALSVIIGISAMALSIGALATGTISH